jgi:hypothetical protein
MALRREELESNHRENPATVKKDEADHRHHKHSLGKEEMPDGLKRKQCGS